MDVDSANDKTTDNSISGQSAALFVAEDDSLAALVVSHGIRVRDFILLSFLANLGSMSMGRLARIAGIEIEMADHSLQRLSAAGLVLRDPTSAYPDTEVNLILTGRGLEIANRINDQLP
jgi:DNA-binding MarR family transcriptional regulator